jgi:GR25 family glycosyltransferase involved in LPS biosynthesis
MNINSLSGLLPSLRGHARYRTRRLSARRQSTAFASADGDTAIERIYVINLDRAQERWSAVNRELSRFKDPTGQPLSMIARRFSAIDARYLKDPAPPELLDPIYTLAEQLLVDPHPDLDIDDAARATQIAMTPQEIAVALSHIHVWKLVAGSSAPYTLILEDDAYITRTCMSVLEQVWRDLRANRAIGQSVDLLYLSFQETGEDTAPRERTRPVLRRPTRGLWQLSGYVLSQAGAHELLRGLPAHGPIDLWINQQFGRLSVRMTNHPVIEQRPDIASSNSYSVMPVLSRVGAIRRDTPQAPQRRPGKDPVVVVGEPGTGLSTAAEALSVLGFRCISDLTALPPDELDALLRGSRRRMFDAYVNIGSLGLHELERLASTTRVRLIVTAATARTPQSPAWDAWEKHLKGRRLLLSSDDHDPWQRLTRFLTCEYPTHPWPQQPEHGQRIVTPRSPKDEPRSGRRLAWDISPWIIHRAVWPGIRLKPSVQEQGDRTAAQEDGTLRDATVIARSAHARLDENDWYLREDTFPSNRALFRPGNVTQQSHSPVLLTLRREASKVRDLTGAAIASRRSFTYGTVSAELRVPTGSGLVTGLFLHRNSPRQEIDIEFLGRDTTCMLVNVFYNPGATGTRLEHGYRGTPVVVDLGFDASDGFHHYEIDWQADRIRWQVDGVTVHERFLWDPTPIPNQPMEFNVNLWSSESAEFAGPLDEQALPAVLEVASLQIF